MYKIDLNNDGQEEIFVSFPTLYFCGSGGCTVLLLNQYLEVITRFSPVRDIYVKSNTAHDWKVLITKSGGKWRSLIYSGGTYPSNPSVIEAAGELPNSESILLFDEDKSHSKLYNF